MASPSARELLIKKLVKEGKSFDMAKDIVGSAMQRMGNPSFRVAFLYMPNYTGISTNSPYGIPQSISVLLTTDTKARVIHDVPAYKVPGSMQAYICKKALNTALQELKGIVPGGVKS